MDSPSTAMLKPHGDGMLQIRNEETKSKAKRELIIMWNTRTEVKDDEN
jgi:hypothetical protein